MKKIISFVLSICLIFAVISIHYVNCAFAETTDNTYFELGSYPQTKVTDESLVSLLNSASSASQWISYGYCSGDDISTESSFKSDYMFYIDITFNGAKYRGVKFDGEHYRPLRTWYSNDDTNSVQDNNGYINAEIYWFKYEPLVWELADESSGLSVCKSIIDSQSFNDTLVADEFKDSAHSIKANDFSQSDIRTWLNNNFYNSAFNESEKKLISESTAVNGCVQNSAVYGSSSDYVFLLSADEFNAYSFEKSKLYTDYSLSQGFNISRTGSYYWKLRTGDSQYKYSVISVNEKGSIISDNGYLLTDTDTTGQGIVPAVKINRTGNSSLGSDASGTVDYRNYVSFTAVVSGDMPEDCYLAVYDSSGNCLKSGDMGASSVSYKSYNEIKSLTKYTVKLMSGNAVCKDGNGNDIIKEITVNVNSGFFLKIVAFFRGVFSEQPTKTI